MVGKLLGEHKRRGEEIRAWREISERKGGRWSEGRERKTLKKDTFNSKAALRAEALFVANTGVKGEGLRHPPAWIFTRLEAKKRRNQGTDRRKMT